MRSRRQPVPHGSANSRHRPPWLEECARQIADAGRELGGARGWTPATSSNLLLDEAHAAVTISSRDRTRSKLTSWWSTSPASRSLSVRRDRATQIYASAGAFCTRSRTRSRRACTYRRQVHFEAGELRRRSSGFTTRKRPRPPRLPEPQDAPCWSQVGTSSTAASRCTALLDRQPRHLPLGESTHGGPTPAWRRSEFLLACELDLLSCEGQAVSRLRIYRRIPCRRPVAGARRTRRDRARALSRAAGVRQALGSGSRSSRAEQDEHHRLSRGPTD